MKRISFIAILIFWIASATANPVDVNTAKKAAEHFFQSKTGAKVELRLIDYADRSSFTNFFVFGTNNSFVIISANDCIQPVLGYSTENNFGTERIPENLYCWLENYEQEIAALAKSGQKPSKEVCQAWDMLISGTLPRSKDDPLYLIQTQWNQTEPYNLSCPSGTVTGCVATAMAQVMKYYDYPNQGFGSHSYIPAAHPDYGEQSVDFGTATYDWGNMTNTFGVSSTNPQKQAVAKLMYHCGVSVNMNYGTNAEGGSSATSSDVAASLQNYFNYSQSVRSVFRSNYSSQQWTELLIQEISESRPIQYWGSRKKEDGNIAGHSFICDGYNSENAKFHFNWGWGGSSDGWFYITGNETPQNQYPLYQGAIIGIRPIDYKEQPTELVAIASGRDVNLTWTGLESADSYNVYCDYNYIGNTSSCSFTDTNLPIGSHLYFVRGVKNGDVSLPSNIATTTVVFNGSTEELKIDRLNATYDNRDATLEWTSPYRLNYIDYHSFDNYWYYTGTGNKELLFWGARFPASMLSSGTTLTSVSYLFNTEGEYTISIYQCTGGVPSGAPVTQVTATYPKGWNNIYFPSPSPLSIDHEKDLWVVFKSTSIPYPITLGEYNADDGNYYSYEGSDWLHLSGCSFFISANISDGSITYNIYDNETKVADGLTSPGHTLSNISTNNIHRFSVKAQKGAVESTASNIVGCAVGSVSLTSLSLDGDNKMTVTQGSTLTVTGSITNDDPANLIVEDGGQLIPANAVAATMRKNIASYSSATGLGNTDGWHFIALPLDDNEYSPTDAMLSGTYDLYRLNPTTTTWENFKQTGDHYHFKLTNGQGYLYANNTDDFTIDFAGTVKASAESQTVDVLAGWNLIGNPFTYNVHALTSYYVMNAERTGLNPTMKSSSDVIKPCEGIVVNAASSGSVTFSKTIESSTNNNGNIQIAVTEQVATRKGTSTSMTDKAIVSFNEGDELCKFYFGSQNANIYIPQDGEEYAIAHSESQGVIPVCFKAKADGEYTITVNPEKVEMSCLLLIDNITGKEVDLMVSPSYTFNAKTNDYASRFKLAFSTKSNNNETVAESFAFISDGQIIVTDTYDNATLQVIDMTGRVVMTCRGGAHTVPTTGMTPGVYVLRIIAENKIKTQKIIIK